MFKIIEGNFKDSQYSNEEYLDNWPLLYILENGKQAYIGESTHAKTRMTQHATVEEKRIFDRVHFIYSKLFNQSVTFDYESKLIQYIVADELFQVTNKNSGIADKQYYQKKEYDEKFEVLWKKLQKEKLVKHSLEEIENSDLFKYSPYKELNDSQQKAVESSLSMYVGDFQSAVKDEPVEMIKIVIENKENVVPAYIDAMYSGAEFSDAIELVEKNLWEQMFSEFPCDMRSQRALHFCGIIEKVKIYSWSDEVIEKLSALVKYDLLIIDDLGAERGTEYAVENVFNVIDRRYRSGKPLIITTNLHLSMLTNEQSLDKKRIYDRILELCIPVCVNGASKRTATAKEKMKEMQEIAKSYQKGGDAIE